MSCNWIWRAAGVLAAAALHAASPLTIDYPNPGSVFPPEFPPPTFLFRDPAPGASAWNVDVAFADGSAPFRIAIRGERMKVGEIDNRAVGPTNRLPALTPQQAAARTWKPDPEIWEGIKQHSRSAPAVITISSRFSSGRISIRTSTDPVAAPIFYRDVPLMPSETEKGVIKPLAASAIPLIAWRLRDIAEPKSRVVMEGIHSCANCHSASTDGKTLGMDLDGPLNDKGIYALFPIQPATKITRDEVISWSSHRGKLGGKLRVGFMSQVSPDGRHVVTTVADNAVEQSDYQRRRQPQDLVQTYYVANFTDYRFLQVFYPTRGVLAWYNRETGRLQALPGADDPRYVHTSATWSPDGKYLVFSRASARDPYTAGVPVAISANDPNETAIRYDLYRIPFHDGQGGRAEPVEGASRNGMGNSFPKISPDGKWIVYAQARNGQLMRPDSRLWIVPAAGGKPRLMQCNTSLMNSWHSWSPNGRWLVSSSKARSPYTQMYLTHIDEDGNDPPAILIEDSTAANRAVNIPEFLNIPPGGLRRIDAQVTESFRAIDVATELAKQGDHASAAAEWRHALELGAGEASVHFNLANALSKIQQPQEAIAEYEKALAMSPDHAEAHNNLGFLLAAQGLVPEAIPHFEKALESNPANANAHINLGVMLAQGGQVERAVPYFERAVELKPADVEARTRLGLALAVSGHAEAAIPHLEIVVKTSRDAGLLDLLGRCYAGAGRTPDAIAITRRAIVLAAGNAQLIEILNAHLRSYR